MTGATEVHSPGYHEFTINPNDEEFVGLGTLKTLQTRPYTGFRFAVIWV